MLNFISLQNFRTYAKRDIHLHPQLTMIVGPNAIGKTNILESIYALAIGKSFRADKEEEVISWGKEIARIKGTTEEDSLELMITSGIVGGGYAPKKKFMVNGVARRLIDFTGNVPAILFWPEDLSLIIGSPSIRREYMNRVLIQIDREYRRALSQYEKGLRQRNKLLFFIHEGTADRTQLPYWNDLLVRTGQYITKQRQAFVEYLNTKQEVGNPRKKLEDIYQLTYDKSIISDDRLLQYKNEEVAAKTTLVGPHRDDIIFTIHTGSDGSKELSKFGSRGQQRLAVLWAKLGELSFMEQLLHKRPLLLLDDIFSELDFEHQADVLQLITQYQTVMTSADGSIRNRFQNIEMSLIELG